MELKKVIELAKELNLDYEKYDKDYYFYLPAEWISTGVEYCVEDEDDREAFFVWRHNSKKAVATFNIVVDADLGFYYNDSVDYSKFKDFEQKVRRFYYIITQLQEIKKNLKVQMNLDKIKSDFN